MCVKLCVVIASLMLCVMCNKDSVWLQRAKRTFESEVASNGETDQSFGSSSFTSQERTPDQVNLEKTLLVSHIALNRSSPESSNPAISSTNHNCSDATCLFNLLTQVRPDVGAPTTSTQKTTVTRRYYGENEEFGENIFSYSTKQTSTTKPRRVTFDPNQESNLQPAQYTTTKESSVMTSRIIEITTTAKTTTTSTISSTTSSTTPPTTTSTTTIATTHTTNVVPTSLVEQGNDTLSNIFTTEMPHGIEITSSRTRESKSNRPSWSFNFGSNTQKGNKEDEHVLAYMLKCGVYPACHVTFDNKTTNLFDGIKNVDTRNHFITQSRTIVVKCNDSNIRAITAANVILMLVIVLSNFLIFFVTLKSQLLRKPHGYFKLSLAAADTLTGIITIPSIIANTTRYFDKNQNYLPEQQTLRNNESEAIFFGVVAMFSQLITMYSIFLLSVDSFLSIRWPVKYSIRDLMTPQRAGIMISITWAFAIIVSALPIVSKSYVEYGLIYITMTYTPILKTAQDSSSNTLSSYTPAIVYIALVWAVPFIATWAITILTAVYGKLMLSKMKNITNRQSQTSRKSIERLNADIFRTAFVVLLLFTITVLPCFIMILVNFYNNNNVCMEKGGTTFLFVSVYIIFCGSFVNVFVYNICNSEFRMETKRIFRKLSQTICPHYCNDSCLDALTSSKSKSTKTYRSRLQTNKTSKQSVKKSTSSDLKVVVSPPRPQTIGSCLEAKPGTAHDVYYNDIAGLENHVFEMSAFHANTNSEHVSTEQRSLSSHASGAYTDISNNSTEVEHHTHMNNNEEGKDEKVLAQSETTFEKISKDKNCIEYTI